MLFGVGFGARLPHLLGIHKDTMYSAGCGRKSEVEL